jgi:2-amino-4-hydroxy-6-hydroxymethyldihydropteridine diphosphokinase
MNLSMSHTAYLSLGSNIGDREANLRDVVTRLSALGEIIAVSSLYETAPMEVEDQPWFLNAAVELRTDLAPADLLREILAIEKLMGRVRSQPKGPRLIDIDIVLYDDSVITALGLTIPHPAMQDRLFVLQPLAEIAPDLTHPVSHRKIAALRESLASAGQAVRRRHGPWFTRT